MRKQLSFLMIFLLFVLGVARATIVSNLNVATLPVDNASASVRQTAFPKALGRVLIKMSGNLAVMTLPAVQNTLDAIDGMIQSYGYNRQEQPNGKSQLMLQVTFDQKALKQLLRQAGQANWSRNRPMTLLWLQVQNKGLTQILSNVDDAELAQVVQLAAKERGLPIVLPAMDLRDQNFVYSGVENFDTSLLQQAGQRYGAKVILGGIVQESGGQWEGEWLLLMKGAPYKWRNKAGSLSALLQRSVNDMANLMANQLAVSDNKNLQTVVMLDVGNVVALSDYAKVLSILRRLPPVAGVSVVDMNASDLLLKVKTVGGAQALSDALSSQRRFAATEDPDEANSKADLFYRWVSNRPAKDRNAGP